MALWPKSIQSPGLGGICNGFVWLESLTNGRSLFPVEILICTVLSIYDEITHVLSPIVNPHFCFA